MIVFLASDYSGYMTGEVCSVRSQYREDPPWIFGAFVGMIPPGAPGAAGGQVPSSTSCGPSSTSLGGRSLRFQVRMGHRAPLPRRVLRPVGERGVDGVRAGYHRQHPHRLGDHQHHAAGLLPGRGRREGGDARSARARYGFQFGTRRGSSSVEALGFGIGNRMDMTVATTMRGPRPDHQDDGTRGVRPLRGRSPLPPRRQVLPKPVTKADAPLGRGGVTGHVQKAARMGIGVPFCSSFVGPRR